MKVAQKPLLLALPPSRWQHAVEQLEELQLAGSARSPATTVARPVWCVFGCHALKGCPVLLDANTLWSIGLPLPTFMFYCGVESTTLQA